MMMLCNLRRYLDNNNSEGGSNEEVKEYIKDGYGIIGLDAGVKKCSILTNHS